MLKSTSQLQPVQLADQSTNFLGENSLRVYLKGGSKQMRRKENRTGEKSGDELKRRENIGVARGCSGCTCNPRAVKIFFQA